MFEVEKIRKDFPMLNNTMNGHPLVYLDNSATTFKPQEVIDGVNYFYSALTANTHRGDYDIAFKVDTEIDNARSNIARFIGCDPKEVVFTSGCTHSLNLVANSFGKQLIKKDDVILLTYAEHASNVLPWFKLAEETGARIEYIPLTEEGRLTVDNVHKAINEKVKLISIAQVGNVLGYAAPIKEICQLAHNNGIKVIVDGAQSVPHLKINVRDLDCDFLTFSGHKMCGPSGIGVLYGKKELLDSMEPTFYGGGSNARFKADGEILLKETPEKFEAGTPNIEGIMGLSRAVTYLENIGMDEICQYEKELAGYLIDQLKEMDNIILYNPNSDTGIVTFNVKDIFPQDASGYLNHQGIAVRSGNHCAKLLVNQIGTDATIRCSIYFYNTKEDVDQLVEALKTCTIENCLATFF